MRTPRSRARGWSRTVSLEIVVALALSLLALATFHGTVEPASDGRLTGTVPLLDGT
jgi:hypothetical protein